MSLLVEKMRAIARTPIHRIEGVIDVLLEAADRIEKLEAVAEVAKRTRPSDCVKRCPQYQGNCYDCTRGEWDLSCALAALEAP